MECGGEKFLFSYNLRQVIVHFFTTINTCGGNSINAEKQKK